MLLTLCGLAMQIESITAGCNSLTINSTVASGSRCGLARLQSLKMPAQNRFDGSWLTRFIKTNKQWRRNQPVHDSKDRNCLVANRALQNHRIQCIHTLRYLRQAAKHAIYLIEFFMQGSRALEIRRFARRFPFALHRSRQGGPAGFQRLEYAIHFDVVIFLRAAREARREAHLHLRIYAPGKAGVAANLDLAAANLEKVEKLIRERFSSLPRHERTKIITAVLENPSRDVTA